VLLDRPALRPLVRSAKIGSSRLAVAPTPLHLSCGDCREPLRVEGPAVPILVGMLVLFTLAVGGAVLAGATARLLVILAV
jgi:hypothetical protein